MHACVFVCLCTSDTGSWGYVGVQRPDVTNVQMSGELWT